MARPKSTSIGFDYDDLNIQERVSWNTEKVEQLLVAMEEGYKPKSNPFYEGNINLRKGNIVFDYTDEEIQEIHRCATDIVYFANNYCTVMTEEGLQRITLRPYQEDMLRQFQDERFNIVLAARQIGKTICASIFIAWYVLFNFDKNALVLANKGVTTTEIIDKGKTIIEHLPFFLKPGIIKWDVMTSKFDNGCRIIGQTTTPKAGIGFTIHLLFMDEFAHIPHTFLNTFYENVFPTISAGKNTKVIITSTPNGFNLFEELYTAAVEGRNEYTPFKVNWWDVPGRDKAWMEREIGLLGGEEAFNRQHGNQFISSSALLLSPDVVQRLSTEAKEFEFRSIIEMEDLNIDYSGLLWEETFSFDEIDEEHYYVFSVDVAEGSGGDYSVINIFEIDVMDKADWTNLNNPSSFLEFFRLKQIGLFKSNERPIDEFTKILYTLIVDIFYVDNLKVVLEWNTFGGEVLNRLSTVFPARNNFDEEVVVKFHHRLDAKSKKFGLKLKSDNKPIICQNFKKLTFQNRITLLKDSTIEEAMKFGKVKGKWQGQAGHDDEIMTSINASEFFKTIDYSEFVEEKYDYIDENTQREIEEILNRDIDGGNLNYDIYDLV